MLASGKKRNISNFIESDTVMILFAFFITWEWSWFDKNLCNFELGNDKDLISWMVWKILQVLDDTIGILKHSK